MCPTFCHVAKGILRALGEELRARRVERGISQEELADRAGLHRNYVGLLERGQRNVTVLVLQDLAGALKVSLSELIVQAERRSR